MSKILVPCDFSGQAMDAFRFAIELAQPETDEVELLHIIELPVLNDTTLMPTLSFEAEYMKEAAEQARKNFQRMINPVKPV
ncbi:MAG: universal stress protein [Bacteroidota bacterium]